MTDEILLPCIACETPCNIFEIQLRDFFTLKYLRLCNAECLFKLSYDFLYELYEHKTFDNHLFNLENEEDRKLRMEYQDIICKEADIMMRESLKKCKDLLSSQVPECILDHFKNKNLPIFSEPMIFKKYNISKEAMIKSQEKYIDDLREKLSIAEEDLMNIKSEPNNE